MEISSKLTPFQGRMSARQITKVEKMKTINMKIQSHYSPLETIVNISKRQQTTPEKSVLNKGIKQIPYLDLIAPT